MIRRSTLTVALLLTSLIAPPASAMDAFTIPEGVFLIGYEFSYKTSDSYFRHVFGTGTESMVEDYNNIAITLVDVLPLLLPGEDSSGIIDAMRYTGPQFDQYEQMFGHKYPMNLGTTKIDFDLHGEVHKFGIGYGITDQWTVGVFIPLQVGALDFDVDLINSDFKRNESFDPTRPVSLGNLPMLPLGSDFYENYAQPLHTPRMIRQRRWQQQCNNPALNHPVTGFRPEGCPLGAAELMWVLTDPAFGFEYKELEQGEQRIVGLGDILFATRYGFYQSDDWRMALTNYWSLPTGKFQDPDKIYDSKLGDSQLDIGLMLSVDWIAFKEWSIFRELWVGLALAYTMQFPDEREMRVWSHLRDEQGNITGILPIAPKSSKVKLTRDYGDSVDAYFSGGLGITDFVSVGYEFYYYYQFEDKYSGPNAYHPVDNPEGFEYDALAWQSSRESVDFQVFAQFTTLPWVLSGDFPVPIMLKLGWGRSLIGKNIDVVTTWTAGLMLVGHVGIFTNSLPD